MLSPIERMIDAACGFKPGQPRRFAILVCGGRAFDDKPLLFGYLDGIHGIRNITEVIHGGATGADSLAGAWARKNSIKETIVLADWKKYPRAAGPMRNSQMLKLNPDAVVAFPGGRGTMDMVNKAKRKGIFTDEVPADLVGGP